MFVKVFTLSVLAALGIVIVSGGTASASCLAPQLDNGTYVNVDSDTRSITRLNLEFRCAPTRQQRDGGGTITHGADPHFQIRMWGSCSPTDCDWGTAKAEPTGSPDSHSYGTWEASYDQGFAERRVEIHPLNSDRLRLVVHSTYDDNRDDRTSTNVMELREQHSIVISSADVRGGTDYTLRGGGMLELVEGELDGHRVSIQDNDNVYGDRAEGHVAGAKDGYLVFGALPEIVLENPENAVVYIDGQPR